MFPHLVLQQWDVNVFTAFSTAQILQESKKKKKERERQWAHRFGGVRDGAGFTGYDRLLLKSPQAKDLENTAGSNILQADSLRPGGGGPWLQNPGTLCSLESRLTSAFSHHCSLSFQKTSFLSILMKGKYAEASYYNNEISNCHSSVFKSSLYCGLKSLTESERASETTGRSPQGCPESSKQDDWPFWFFNDGECELNVNFF